MEALPHSYISVYKHTHRVHLCPSLCKVMLLSGELRAVRGHHSVGAALTSMWSLSCEIPQPRESPAHEPRLLHSPKSAIAPCHGHGTSPGRALPWKVVRGDAFLLGTWTRMQAPTCAHTNTCTYVSRIHARTHTHENKLTHVGPEEQPVDVN